MAEETSYGIIALRKLDNQWQVLLVHHNQGHWSFPKGRIEPGETPKECAAREFHEETNLTVAQFLSDLPFVEHYTLYRGPTLTQKTVTYYVAEASGTPHPQQTEVSECRWVDSSDAESLLTFPAVQHLLKEVLTHVSTL